jgi:hypothetical protein
MPGSTPNGFRPSPLDPMALMITIDEAAKMPP